MQTRETNRKAESREAGKQLSIAASKIDDKAMGRRPSAQARQHVCMQCKDGALSQLDSRHTC